MPHRDSAPLKQTDTSIRDAAALWVVRHDRGLSENEAEEFKRWLPADPRHASAFARSAAAWRLLDEATSYSGRPNGEGNNHRHIWRRLALPGLAAAAAVLFWVSGWRAEEKFARPVAGPAPSPSGRVISQQTVVLPDGTLVRLNVGTELIEDFTPTQRSVRLVRGEAHFTVTKNPARPFVVHAGDVDVRAVGTAFNVHLQAQAVDVLVTEGKVQVHSPLTPSSPSPGITSGPPGPLPLVVAGQRALVALAPSPVRPAIVISEVAAAEVANVLAWREPMLRLGGATLAELAVEFQRQTGRRLVLVDPSLANLRMGGRFRSDDVEGFIRVLEEVYGIKSERAADGTLLIGKAP